MPPEEEGSGGRRNESEDMTEGVTPDGKMPTSPRSGVTGKKAEAPWMLARYESSGGAS